MDETPSDPPPRRFIASIDSDGDPTSMEATAPNRFGLWLGAFVVIVAAVAAFYAIRVQGQGKEETAAIRSAVKVYAEMFRVSPQTIHKYCKFRVTRADGGGSVVRITRVIVPDNEAGYGITSIFKVDRTGTCEYVGQEEVVGK